MRANVPIPKFASTGGTLSCELRVRGPSRRRLAVIGVFPPGRSLNPALNGRIYLAVRRRRQAPPRSLGRDMGLGRRKATGRREPRFDAFPIPGFGLRLTARDRPAGPPPEESKQARRAPPARKEGRAAKEDRPRAEKKVEAKPARKNAGRGGGGKRRSLTGRLVYWGFV